MSAVAERPKKKRRRSRKPPADSVASYAIHVLEGGIVAGRAVVMACRRHIRDMERQRTPEFPYYFDVDAAEHIIEFFPSFLTLEDGSDFELMDWQQFVIGSVFGWKRVSDGLRRFQTAYVETGKGSGKTPMLAGIGLYGLAFDDAQNAEIYSAAFDKDQASIMLNDAIRMARASEDLSAELDIGKYNIAHLASGSFFRSMSSEHRSKSGQRPHMGLIDELHEHRDGVIVNKVRAGFKGDPQPLLFEITNSGHDRTSICWQHHQHSIDVLEGHTPDEQWFAYVCQLDPCDRCFEEGYRQPRDGCERCDSWTDPATWRKVAPSQGVTITDAYLQTQVDLAIAMPSDQALTKRLNFCIWTESHQVWISSDQLDACRVESVSSDNLQARPCAAGLDLSSKHDLSSLVIAIRIDDPKGSAQPETASFEGLDEETGERKEIKITLDFSVELVPFFWIPRETLLERVKTERIPYDVWERAGRLFVTDGPTIDHSVIYDFIVDQWKRYRIQRLGYDQHDATMFAVALRDRARLGKAIVEVGQGKKLSEAFKLMEVLVRSRRLRFDGHPVFAWNVANAEPKRDRLNALWIEKPSETKRIDGVIAAAMAIKELMVLPATRRRVGAFIA